jgi:ABC-type phosphate/phosphonate transport system ATPase subunit
MSDILLPCRATEMDVTMIGLQNAGKTSLLRVLAVSA